MASSTGYSVTVLILGLCAYVVGIVLYKVTEPVVWGASILVLIGLLTIIGAIFMLCLDYSVGINPT